MATGRQQVVREISGAIDKAARNLGYSDAKPDQKKAVTAFVSGSDVFVSLPTGSGKSFCYWCLPDVFDRIKGRCGESMVLVVSPLVALMMDQVASLANRGVRAIHVSSELDEKAIEEIHEGKYQILFFSPEQLLQNLAWREMLLSPIYNKNLVGFVVDEAHCVKKW